MAEHLKAVILDYDVAARMRLKQVCNAIPELARAKHFSNHIDCFSYIKTLDRLDILFISSRVPPEVSEGFILDLRPIRAARDMAVVQVVRPHEQDGKNLASRLLAGMHAFLFEPYSVDSLAGIAALARRMKNERAKAREEAALHLLVREIVSQLGEVCFLRGSGMQGNVSMRALEETCGVLRELPPYLQEKYFAIAIEHFIDCPPPKRTYQRRPSQRMSAKARRETETRLIRELNREGRIKRIA